MRTSCPVPNYIRTKANCARRVEHNDVDIVAVNDPFIEPHYAVSITRPKKDRNSHPLNKIYPSFAAMSYSARRQQANAHAGVHAQV